MPQTTLISFFKYNGIVSQWNAFTRMGFPPLKKNQIPGLVFWKALGSGGKNGFSIRPDFSVYALLTVFESEEMAFEFSNSAIMQSYLDKADKHSHIYMYNVHAHGQWAKQQPFKEEIMLDRSKPMCVITRATIKPLMAAKFWRYVPSVSAAIEDYEGLVYSKGIGEWPIFMQATFSAWQSAEDMMSYAYKNKRHAEMIKKTRELGWYREELFSRFHPFQQIGDFLPSFL
ncbi:hypothetical protein [Ascidiimonas sp. W6]|uniref:hypothetical protein n=1 Tax=Ascidiimonas meishanensis TaxID=3128903 RepID=UPI0030EBF5D7